MELTDQLEVERAHGEAQRARLEAILGLTGDAVLVMDARGMPVLVKLSYVGRPSRAEFALTREFAERSTNSTVGLTGRATVIENVRQHVEAGGGFYVCDADVQSEACLPIVDLRREVAGIVDAEAKPAAFFGAERLAVIAALALVAGPVLP